MGRNALTDQHFMKAALADLVEQFLDLDRRIKQLIVAVIDGVSCVVAVWLSFMIRLGEWVGFQLSVLLFAAFVLVCVYAVFVSAGVYNNLFRFHGPKSVSQIARCCLVISLPTVAIFGYVSVPGIPRTVSAIFPLVLFVVVACSRIVARFFLVEMLEPRRQRRRVVIYGAGRAGRQLALSLQHERSYTLVAYADDDPTLAGQRLEGTPILGFADLSELLDNKEVDLVLLAMPSLGRSGLSRIVKSLQHFDVRVKTLPSVREIDSGKVSVSDLREIEVTDLLRRDPVTPNSNLLRRSIEGKVVLVTGAGGSIGGELSRQILNLGPKRLILVEMSEASLFTIEQSLLAEARLAGVQTEICLELGSVAEGATVSRLFDRWKPQTVYHAAAYKHVPLVEANIVSGVRNNVLGTLSCALAARASGAERFVLVSTDKAVRPTNVMGASKRVCELILQALAAEEPRSTIFTMVRFGNVLGSSGSVVPHFSKQIAQGGPVTLTHRDITRFFMTIPEAAELVIQAGSMALGGEVYLLDMGEPVRIYDLARSMITMSGCSIQDEENPEGDIAIVEVGLRPGEKLFEELLINAEAQATPHERIFVARESHLSWNDLSASLALMQERLLDGDGEGVTDLLTTLVGGFSRPARKDRNAHAQGKAT